MKSEKVFFVLFMEFPTIFTINVDTLRHLFTELTIQQLNININSFLVNLEKYK